MSGPFYNNVKGTTAGTPGTGSFVPNAAASGALAWSTVPAGWMGMVRFADGSAWGLAYVYWDGTNLVRPANGFVSSSTGAQLSLTSAATAEMVVDANEVQPHLTGSTPRGWISNTGADSITTVGVTAGTVVGTGAAGIIATTNYLTEQPRRQYTSATTANAQCGYTHSVIYGVVNTAAGRGGVGFGARFGASQIPAAARLFVGMLQSSSTMVGTAEPSAVVSNVMSFAKDSTDTNIQLLVNNNSGSGTKTDTGIPLVANGWYESLLWIDPGSNKVWGRLFRVDTGDIWFGSTTTDVPVDGALLIQQVLGGLKATTGTAFVLHIGQVIVRTVQ